MLSIFATPAEAKAWSEAVNKGREKHQRIGVPRRPLKQKTLERIARGLDKFVLKAKRPFIVDIQNYGWNSTTVRDVEQPMPTVTGGPKGGGFAAVDVAIAPYTAGVGGRAGQSPATSLENPLPTVTGKADRVIGAALLTRFHGDKLNGEARWGENAAPLPDPLPTVTGSKDYALTCATLQTLNHGGPEHRAQSPSDPLATVTGANDARALVAALVTKHYGGHETPGSSLDKPIDSITAKDHNAVTVAYLNKHRGESPGTAADEPMLTVTSGAGAQRDAGATHAMGVTCAYLSNLYGTNQGSNGDVAKPAPTITGSSNHAALVAAFLSTYYGNGGETSPADPMATVTGRDRLALVTVVIDGQTYVVTDIAMRMLTPRELARAQGFDDSYIIDRLADGTRISKADQVKLIGNSVCPPVARAIVKANIIDQGVLDERMVTAGAAS